MNARYISLFFFLPDVNRAVEESLAEVHSGTGAATAGGDVHPGADGGR